MPRYYLHPIGDSTKFSDAGDYPETPQNPLEGFEWVAGTPSEDATPYVQLTLAETLESLFLNALSQLGGLLNASERGQLFFLKAGVVEALKFDIAAAKALIEDADLPNNEQVEAARQVLLAQFPV